MRHKKLSNGGGRRNWVKPNRKKPPGSKFRHLAMPEDLETLAAPSDSLVGLLAIAEGLQARRWT